MMFMTAIVLNNLRQRPGRSLFTVAGIAIGIAAFVALGSLARGFENSWVRMYTARGTDLIVTKAAVLSPIPPPFAQEQTRDLRSLPRVTRTSGVLSDLLSIEHVPIILVMGLEPETFVWEHLRLVKGRWPANAAEPAVLLGTVASDVLRKSIGSPIQIEAGAFTVCGIFESAAVTENGAIVMTLPQLQRVTEQNGNVNFVNLRLASGSTGDDVESLRRSILGRLPGFRTFTAGEIVEGNAAVQLVKAMSLATSGTALVVGAVGVMNTVMMSVFERIHEIGIMLAVGWRRRQIVTMILYESIALSVAGGLAGSAIGTATVKALQITPLLRGRLDGDFGAGLYVAAMGTAVGLGLLGGLYPAYRGSRLQPAAALRHE